MNIVVCLKQVPDTSQVRIHPETHTLIRTGVESIVNPYDLHALEEAVRLTERFGGCVTALTMGPPQSERVLREAMARGAHRGVLCSDKAFGGADTWATSFTLSEVIKDHDLFPDSADLVICGKQAVDGDTAQVGPALAEHLQLPLLPYVRRIRTIETGDDTPGTATAANWAAGYRIEAECLDEDGITVLRSPLPAVLTVVKELNVPRKPSLSSWHAARHAEIELIDNSRLRLPREAVGLPGSPTRVRRITGVSHTKETVFLHSGEDQTAATIGELLLNSVHGVSNNTDTDPPPDQSIEPAAPATSPAPTDETATESPVIQHPIIVVIGEDRGGDTHSSTFELVNTARDLASECSGKVVVLLPVHDTNTTNRAQYMSDEVYFVRQSTGAFESGDAVDSMLPVIEKIRPSIILGAATYRGRTLLPRLATRLKTGLTADCTELEIDPETGLLLQRRPAFGGNVLATIVCAKHTPQMATVRPGVFKTGRKQIDSRIPGVERSFDGRDDGVRTVRIHPRVVSRLSEESSGSILDARILVSGGKGIGGPAGFEQLRRIANLVGGSVGASRSAVEAGWVPYSHQVGQTGRTIQPEVYLALGISGAVQHLVGMQSSKTVIAVNTDPDAPIFGVADYGAVIDYRSLMPPLLAYLEERIAENTDHG